MSRLVFAPPIFVALIFAVCCVAHTEEDATKEETWEGFRGLKWGQVIQEGEEFTKVDTDGDIDAFTRKGDKLTIGTANLKSIVYFVYDTRLMSVQIKAQGKQTFEYLKSTLASKYGRSIQPNEFIEKYFWLSENNIKSGVGVILSINPITEEIDCVFCDLTLMNERKKKQEESAKKAAQQDL